MVPASFRPRLRAVETIVVPDQRHGKVLVLRDTQGIARGHAMLPPPLVPIIARFDGSRTCEQIARDVAADLGEVPVEIVRQLATQLDDGLFLESATFERALDQVKKEFDDSAVRVASHAGGAYPGTASELADYIDSRCIARANGSAKPGKMLGLVAPHIDPWRGAVGYGHAYGALAKALPAEADTFILFGTSHAPMREPFALLRKGYDTPEGVMPVDVGIVDALAAASDFDPWHDRLNHKREHSLEFQAVFLRHVLGASSGGREARIVPILAGLGEHQVRGSQPGRDKKVAKFLDAIRGIVAARPGKVIVVAGADLAHVGPRFGDPKPFDARERSVLESTDRASLEHATLGASADFWSHVASDLEARRVCGLAPIFSLLEVLPEKTTGEVLHYEQTIDDEDGSIVSHAAVGFYG